MRAWGMIGLAGLVLAGTACPSRAQEAASACQKTDFEAVVDQAASALRDLNAKNKPPFQDKLRQLKDKRAWSQEQFMAAAAPFVRDDQIAIYDQQSEDLLDKISSLGQEGSQGAEPDCALLSELRAHMKVLVDTQTVKWAYMSGKLDGELAK